MSKTNAVRIIESHNIPFSIATYEVDENDLSGINAAEKINADPDTVFKTLVSADEKNNIIIFSIPVTQELDLKKAARASGRKKIELIKVKDIFSVTGYQRGGCSPVGMKKNYPFFIDETSLLADQIFISAGKRGMQIRINPDDLLKITGGTAADLCL
jgi:Cys-tRNA(Pro)/Cys-tRNA(Cys) deacylase